MGGGGDPSPVTAYGTYMGIKASAKQAWGNDSLSGKSAAVMGIGKVGMHLLEYLHKEGVKLYVADINDSALQAAASQFGATIVSGEEMIGLDVDIFAPCALGGIINDVTLPKLKCQIVAGAANNQLEDEKIHGDLFLNSRLDQSSYQSKAPFFHSYKNPMLNINKKNPTPSLTFKDNL